MSKYKFLQGKLQNISWESISKTFEFLSRMPLGFGMFAQQYSPIRQKVAEVTKSTISQIICRKQIACTVQCTATSQQKA